VNALTKSMAKQEQPVAWVGEPPPANERGLYGARRMLFKGHKWERQKPEREQKQHDFKVEHDQKR
jgi:large subunit ribosomal protein L25